ncbi:Negative regulator of mitotic exit [Tulasnella sp. 424]|nr:Negative regulator of mitotic exit [Tulasnella sp. 424]
MFDRFRGWLKTLDLSLPSQRRSRSASGIIDRRTQPENVEATRFTPLADQPHREVSPSHPSREGSPETPEIEETTGTLTTHTDVDRKLGSPVPTIGKATAPQEIYTSGGFDATAGNTTASNGAVAGTKNILTAKGPRKPEVDPEVPRALTWTEHDLRESFTSDDSMGDANYRAFVRIEQSCTAIPNSDGEFIIFGGMFTGEGPTTWTNHLSLLSTTDMSLTRLETNGVKPVERTAHGAVIVGRVLVVFGGHASDSHLHFLNLDTHEWSKLRPPAPYPGPRYGHSFILVDDTIWLFGGRGWPEPAMDDMWCIKLGSDDIEYVQWRQIPKKEPWPGALSYHSTVYYSGSLYL